MAALGDSMARNPLRSGVGGQLGGGCLMLFSLPFVVVGAGIAVASLMGEMKWEGAAPGSPPSLSAMVFGGCFGMVFFSVGGAMFYGGLRQLLGWSETPAVASGAVAGAPWRRGDHEWKHVHIPAGPNRKNAGRHGGVPLSTSGGAWVGFWVLLVFATFWNGIVAVAVMSILASNKQQEWGAFVGIGLFGLVGLGLLVGLGYMVARLLLTGKTSCELSAEPLAPGDEAVAFVYQAGNYAIERSTIRLVCREKATYRQGTDTVTKTNEAWSTELLNELGLTASVSRPLAEVRFRVPEGAMHSFKASKNEVEWGISVKLTIAGLPDVDEFFVFRVAPDNGAPGGGR